MKYKIILGGFLLTFSVTPWMVDKGMFLRWLRLENMDAAVVLLSHVDAD